MKVIESFQIPGFDCVNCDLPVPWSRMRKIYCSDFCKEESKHVRYFRKKFAEGIIEESPNGTPKLTKDMNYWQRKFPYTDLQTGIHIHPETDIYYDLNQQSTSLRVEMHEQWELFKKIYPQHLDVFHALQTRIRFLNAGGYSALNRTISPEIRRIIFQKYNFLCAICSKSSASKYGAGDIDHVSGSSNELSNLQLLCRACHNKKSRESAKLNPIIPDDDPRAEKIDNYNKKFFRRIFSETPLNNCDDHELWEYQYSIILTERKTIFLKALIPVVNPLLVNGVSQREICEILNQNEIPTYSGKGRWRHKLLTELIQLI